jgi:hypothetical protein
MSVGEKKKPLARGKRSPAGSGRASLYAFKCYDDYKEWLEEFAGLYRVPPVLLIDQALVELAKLRGFRAPPIR